MTSFEFPVTERTRTLLRLEQLYQRLAFFMAQDEPYQHHAALMALFEVLEAAGRTELKSELLQEVARTDDGDRDTALPRRDERLLVAARVERDGGVGGGRVGGGADDRYRVPVGLEDGEGEAEDCHRVVEHGGELALNPMLRKQRSVTLCPLWF